MLSSAGEKISHERTSIVQLHALIHLVTGILNIKYIESSSMLVALLHNVIAAYLSGIGACKESKVREALGFQVGV